MDKRINILLVLLSLGIFSFSQRVTHDTIYNDGFEFAYDINDVKYYKDTVTIIYLRAGYNYVAVAARVIPTINTNINTYLEDAKFEIPIKWEQRRLSENRILLNFYPTKYDINLPIEDSYIYLIAKSTISVISTERKLLLRVLEMKNNTPIIYNQNFNDTIQ